MRLGFTVSGGGGGGGGGGISFPDLPSGFLIQPCFVTKHTPHFGGILSVCLLRFHLSITLVSYLVSGLRQV